MDAGTFNWIESMRTEGFAHLVDDSDFGSSYSTSLLWSVTQLGFGTSDRVQPVNQYENIFSVAIVLGALFGVSTTVSTITNQMVQLQLSQTEALFQFDMLRRFCRQTGVPREVSVRVYRFARTMFTQRKSELHMEKITILSCLSRPLLAELRFYLFKDRIDTQGLLRRLLPARPHVVHRLALEAMVPKEFATGDTVFTATEHCDAARSVVTGALTYRKRRRQFPDRRPDEAETMQEVTGGQWLCQACLFTDWVHVGTLQATGNTRMLNLARDPFLSVISKDQIAWQLAAKYGAALITLINEACQKNKLTDIDQFEEETSVTSPATKGLFH